MERNDETEFVGRPLRPGLNGVRGVLPGLKEPWVIN
jgi:hypothetical protein